MNKLHTLIMGCVLISSCSNTTVAEKFTPQSIKTREDLLFLVRRDHIPPFDLTQINNGVRLGLLREADFLAVWDQSSPAGKLSLLRAATPRKKFIKLQPRFRSTWTNGKDENLDQIWLSSFVNWEVRGEIPESELVKFRRCVAQWKAGERVYDEKKERLRDGLRMSQDSVALDIAEKVGLKKKGEKLEMQPPSRVSFRND